MLPALIHQRDIACLYIPCSQALIPGDYLSFHIALYTCLHIYLSIIYLSIYLSSVYLSTYLPTSLPIYLWRAFSIPDP